MINNLSLELENERNSNMVTTNEAISKISQLQEEKALLSMECSQVQGEFDLHFSYCCEFHDALKQVVLEKDNEVEDLNLQLTRIKNMDFSSNPEVFEGVLNEDDIMNYFYNVGSCTNLIIVEVRSANFCKEVQFPDNILEDLYSLRGQVLDVNGFVDAKEMVLTDDYATLLQVIDDGEVDFLEDGSAFLCDVVDGGDDVDVLISHWFYVFMLDDISKEIRKTSQKFSSSVT
ncbi:hypothetical protein L7F22_005727 [Adiantum nelumboides]|nr:hypothetical protein [Adiantum nelumboides]